VDRTVNASDPRGPEASLRSLRPGESATLHLGLTAPKRTGRVYIAVCANPVKSERLTSNNCSSAVLVTVSEPTAAPPTKPTTRPPSGSWAIPGGAQIAPSPPKWYRPQK
jgi:hypothetical protein